MTTVGTFDSDYGRTGTIEVERARCDVCGIERAVITIDPSESEYSPGSICLQCTKSAIARFGNGPP